MAQASIHHQDDGFFPSLERGGHHLIQKGEKGIVFGTASALAAIVTIALLAIGHKAQVTPAHLTALAANIAPTPAGTASHARPQAGAMQAGAIARPRGPSIQRFGSRSGFITKTSFAAKASRISTKTADRRPVLQAVLNQPARLDEPSYQPVSLIEGARLKIGYTVSGQGLISRHLHKAFYDQPRTQQPLMRLSSGPSGNKKPSQPAHQESPLPEARFASYRQN